MLNSISFWKIRLSITAFTFVIVIQLTGCGIVGYSNFKIEDWNMPQKLPNLENTEILLNGKFKENPSVEELSFIELNYTLTRVLRERFNIAQVYSENNNKFTIKIEKSVVGRKQYNPSVWELIHRFSFTIIPYIWADRHSVTYTITAPNNEAKAFMYGYTVQNYSWFPLMFFDPGFSTGIYGNEFYYYQRERLKIYEVFAMRFLTDATPFILSHRAVPSSITTRGLLHD